MFGPAAAVDPVRHLLGTAAGWGGLPETEAFYAIESEARPVGHDTLTFRDVPVDAFWSVQHLQPRRVLRGQPVQLVQRQLGDVDARTRRIGPAAPHLGAG